MELFNEWVCKERFFWTYMKKIGCMVHISGEKVDWAAYFFSIGHVQSDAH